MAANGGLTVLRRRTQIPKNIQLIEENGALGKRFDAYPWRHPVTESSYINSLANRPYRSTVKTLPATLPEPWATVQGPRSKHLGPWSTDLEPWSGGQRLAVQASPLSPRGRRTGVTGDGWWIWIELVRGVGAMFGGGCASDRGWVMDGWRRSYPK